MLESQLRSSLKSLRTPKAQDLERAVLGAILVDKDGIATIKTVFQNPDVFFQKEHQIIFKACMSLDKQNVPIDILMAKQ